MHRIFVSETKTTLFVIHIVLIIEFFIVNGKGDSLPCDFDTVV